MYFQIYAPHFDSTIKKERINIKSGIRLHKSVKLSPLFPAINIHCYTDKKKLPKCGSWVLSDTQMVKYADTVYLIPEEMNVWKTALNMAL
jgi:hypothetical protein